MFTEKELESENWKEIDGYDGMYQVSDLGRVRSFKFGKVRVLMASKCINGYLKVGLWKDGKQNSVYVHRLVADAFIPNNDESKNQVNHIDECKQNNRVDNLEYCTAKYNVNYNGLRYKQPHPQHVRNKIKDLYDQNLSIKQNIELFMANGIECSRNTIWKLRKELGLVKHKEN